MKLKITHKTHYSYSNKIFFEPHYLRFKPKLATFFTVEDFRLKIEPEPLGLSEQFDSENNHVFLCWFEETYKNLKIEASMLLDIKEFNPFNFLIYPTEYLALPFSYNNKTKRLLAPSLQTDSISEPMTKYIQNILKDANHDTITFLINITKQIHLDFNLESRETGAPHEPEYTFLNKKGSCRDLAWMQIQMLRSLGIASRFVSGYLYLNDKTPYYELHAWIEVYVPGAGWIGFDPSHGLLAGNYHIPITSSAFFSNAMPVSGTIRGNAKHKLTNQLNITIS
nr:transglutaminase family protein [uncultured Carboxylicivirga sp.]